MLLTIAWSVAVSGQETLLHSADSDDGVRLNWGADNPAAKLEVQTRPAFVTQGTGSLRASSQAPDPARGTAYVGFRLPIAATRLDGLALSVDAWSTTPEATIAFYVRGFDAAGQQVVGWTSWAHPLSPAGRTFVLAPGQLSDGLGWEADRVQAADQPIVAVEFIAGCVTAGAAFDLAVDNLRTVPAPKPRPANFVDHGPVAPVGMPTWGPSTLAVQGEGGRRQVFTKIWCGNNASYLFIDAATGSTQQVAPGAGGWGAYEVHLGPDQVIYDTMGDQLVAIDAATREVRRLGKLPAGTMALGYTEGADGTIYAGLYPSATLVSYQPATGRFTDHGALNDEVWPQYLRPLAIDSTGWIYGAIAIQESQIVGLNLATGEKRAFIAAGERQRGNPTLHLAGDGKVYATAPGWGWHALSGGSATPVEKAPPAVAPRRSANTFADGSRYLKVNVPDKVMTIQDAGAAEPRTVTFDYESSGVNCYTIVACDDGKIRGATGIPLRIWEFDPATGAMSNRGLGGYGGHINQFVRLGGLLYGAVYSSGALLEYDPAKPYDDVSMATSKNPRQVFDSPAARDLYGRPHAVLAHPDGRHILVGGNAARVLLGSGLLIYDRETEQGTILDRDDLIPDQGINALAALPNGDVLVGTSTQAPTGGAHETPTAALVYRLDFRTRTIAARWPLAPDTPAVRDLVVAADGLVYGLAEPSRFFVLDPRTGTYLHDASLDDYGAASGYQAPRCLTFGPDGMLYALFRGAVVRIDPAARTHIDIARPTAGITTGIAILDGRLYFACGPRLMSCALNPLD